MGPNSNGRRVAVTGMGFITPIGNDVETVWSNMIEGVSGVGPITYFDTSNFDTKIAAQVKGFNPEEYIDRKTARHIGRYCQFALVASQQALAQANLNPAEMDPDDVGVIVSSAMGGMEEIEKSHTALMERGPKRISPFTVSRMMPEMAAGTVAIHTGAGGPNYAIVSACASGAHAIGEASEIIKRGDAVAMLAGGSEAAITPLTMGAFCQIKATSERNDEPEKACRPFDLGRDGFVVGEGSVMLVLEDMEHAK
jgi:3-oxoacyl-[acyl-carrier-protein] synthase II